MRHSSLGMVTGIADKLDAQKAARDAHHRGTGRDLAIVKRSAVDEAFAGLGLVMVEGQGGPRRFIAEGAFEAGSAAGSGLKVGSTPSCGSGRSGLLRFARSDGEG